MSILMLDDAEISEITYPNQWDTLKTHGLAANAELRDRDRTIKRLRCALEVISKSNLWRGERMRQVAEEALAPTAPTAAKGDQ